MKEEYFNTETVTCGYYAILIIKPSLQLTAKCIRGADVALGGNDFDTLARRFITERACENFENGKTKIDFYINRSFFLFFSILTFQKCGVLTTWPPRTPFNNSFGMQPKIWPLKPFLSKPQLIGIYSLEADTIVFFMVANHPLFRSVRGSNNKRAVIYAPGRRGGGGRRVMAAPELLNGCDVTRGW